MKKIGAVLMMVGTLALPAVSLAQVASLNSGNAGGCYDFSMNLKAGANSNDPNVKVQIQNLQAALAKENLAVPKEENGVYGPGTISAVSAFQAKYVDEILAPFGLSSGTGYTGVVTRLKLKSLYGCRQTSANLPPGAEVKIAITSIKLDSDGVTATFCNSGTNDLPSAPFRLRVNGINRDFEIIGAQKAGQCDTETFGYSTWGLTYNQGNTYGAIGIIDPNGFYKTGSILAPLTNTTTLTVPALPGYHLSVRSVTPKTNGIQSTLCNLGTLDLTSFPVKVTVNGNSKDLDIPDAYKAGQCATVTWPYSAYSLNYTPNTTYTVTVVTDPYNVYKEVNELDNTATVVGMP